jgi:hypothetical protein
MPADLDLLRSRFGADDREEKARTGGAQDTETTARGTGAGGDRRRRQVTDRATPRRREPGTEGRRRETEGRLSERDAESAWGLLWASGRREWT